MLPSKNHEIFWRLPVLFLLLGLVGCAQDHSAKTITVNQLQQAYQADDNFFLLDVRSMGEYRAARLKFTDSRIPYDSLRYNLNQLPDDKNRVIYCFCRSGQRSGIATEYLTSQGYNKVYNVVGGIIAWRQAGFPITSGSL